MDSITRTSQSALESYYSVLRRKGAVNQQEKYKLMVLWLFDNLKNHSDYLRVPEFIYDEEGALKDCEWPVDRELEADLEKRYRCNLPCLSEGSCFIHILPDDECIPILNIDWIEDPEQTFTFLVTDATVMTKRIGKPDGSSVEGVVSAYEWNEEANLMQIDAGEEGDYEQVIGLND